MLDLVWLAARSALVVLHVLPLSRSTAMRVRQVLKRLSRCGGFYGPSDGALTPLAVLCCTIAHLPQAECIVWRCL